MKTAILGYGKMGHEIEKILRARKHEVTAVIDNEDDWHTEWQKFLDSDIAIEFSMPDVAVKNLYRCFDNEIPVVSGTTGWHNRLDEVRTYCAEKSGSLVYGTNFSIGVNLFFKAAQWLAEQMSHYPQYEPQIEETHHITKKDKPSGTAITTAEVIMPHLRNMSGWISDAKDEGKLTIISKREGDVSGIHSLLFNSEADELELRHTAKSRAGFAQGAVIAAEWLVNNGGIHDFRTVFANLTDNSNIRNFNLSY